MTAIDDYTGPDAEFWKAYAAAEREDRAEVGLAWGVIIAAVFWLVVFFAAHAAFAATKQQPSRGIPHSSHGSREDIVFNKVCKGEPPVCHWQRKRR